jgi:hypothetical protein
MLTCRYGNKRIDQTFGHGHLRFRHPDFFGRLAARQVKIEAQTPQSSGLDGRDHGQPARVVGAYLLLKPEYGGGNMGKRIFFFLLLFSFLLSAHPPKSIDLSYDTETAVLTVKVWHKVDNQETHYIKKIVVFLGAEQIAAKAYERQQTNEYQEDIFVFTEKPLQKGEPVKVQAFCSIAGEKTVNLKW